MIPGNCAANVNGAVWFGDLRVIQRRCPDHNFAFHAVPCVKYGTATLRAKPSVDLVSAVGRALIFADFANQMKGIFRDNGVCSVTRASNSSAIRTVAMYRSERARFRAVADLPAQATTFKTYIVDVFTHGAGQANVRLAAVVTSPVFGVPDGSIKRRCASAFATVRCSIPLGTT